MSPKRSKFLKQCFRHLPVSIRLESLRFIQRGWYDRIRLTLSCPDNERIPRVPHAGRVRGGLLTMHNGVLIHQGSYYGQVLSVLLESNSGIHEPQEECVFQEVLKLIRPGGTMLELGAYWGFYSIWFARAVPSARCILVEPEEANLAFGKSNLALNNVQAEFLQGWAGSGPPEDPLPVYGVDELMRRYGIHTLNVLHADVQGAELDVLQSARNAVERKAIDYAFISTHSEQLHEQCLRFLVDHGFSIIATASTAESFSEDGVIAARRNGISEPGEIAISRRKFHNTPNAR